MQNFNLPLYDYLREKNESAEIIAPQAPDGPSPTVTEVSVLVSGTPALKRGARATVISGDSVAAPNELNSCCAVVDQTAEGNFSSGVLIADRLVLTASHSAPDLCFVRVPAATFIDGPRIDVAKVIRANADGSPTPDLALLILSAPAVGVVPATLGSAGKLEQARTDGLTLCGFGFARDAFGNLIDAGIKRRTVAAVRLDPPGGSSKRVIDVNREFVAGGENEGIVHDAEVGDSGGPAYLFNTEIVVGITSRNAAGHKSIFTRVDSHLQWISAVAKQNGIAFP